MSLDLFPKTKVTGAAFCNRELERKKLAHYIDVGRHCWIQEYRRHGKTSLVEQTIVDIRAEGKIKLEYARIHLRFASDIDNIAKKLIMAVDTLTRKILTSKLDNSNLSELLSKGGEILTTVFQRLTPSVNLQGTKLNVSTTQVYDLDSLESALRGLDRLAKKFDVRAVIFIDEFQEIGKVNNFMQVESTIRECLEDAECTTYILAGSERTLMAQALIADKNRPLYNHTQILELSRISKEKYSEHLNGLAVERWGCKLHEDTFNKIMFYTQRHPYYVNCLCDEIWMMDTLPSESEVKEAWKYIVQIASRENAHEITAMSPNERKVVISIARGVNTKMTSSAAANKIKLATSSIDRAIQSLIKKDTIAIEAKTRAYYVVDPAIAMIAIQES